MWCNGHRLCIRNWENRVQIRVGLVIFFFAQIPLDSYQYISSPNCYETNWFLWPLLVTCLPLKAMQLTAGKYCVCSFMIRKIYDRANMCHKLHLTHWSCMNSIMRLQSDFSAFSISRNIHIDIDIFNSIKIKIKKLCYYILSYFVIISS